MAVEYSSDVLIGLQYEYMAYHKDNTGEWESEKDRIKRIREAEIQSIKNANMGKSVEVECKVLKNRIGTKGSCYFELYPKYNRFIPEEFRSISEPVYDPANPFEDELSGLKNIDDEAFINKTVQDKSGESWTGKKISGKVFMQNNKTNHPVPIKKWKNEYL